MSRKGAPGPNYRCKFVLRGHKKAISSVKFSPDGLWLATSSADGTCRIWDVETGAFDKALEGHEEGISDVAWAGSSKYLATASDDKTIKMWELASVRVRSLSSEDGGGEGTKGGVRGVLARLTAACVLPRAFPAPFPRLLSRLFAYFDVYHYREAPSH